MFHRWTPCVIATILATIPACSSGRYSGAGFRLPADGDVARGRAAFQAHNCHSCHRVVGTDLPSPTIQPSVPVVLGGEVTERVSDAYLVTSMINPSYRLAGYPVDRITAGGRSRMPSYADRMSARDMTDIVEFLQAQYTVRPPMTNYMYH
jgi:mono/diheme cytochrome c family protein